MQECKARCKLGSSARVQECKRECKAGQARTRYKSARVQDPLKAPESTESLRVLQEPGNV